MAPNNHIRAVKALQDIRVTRTKHGIYACFLTDSRNWSVTALSESTGVTRTAVRNALRDAERLGLVSGHPNTGYSATRPGERLLGRIFEEFEEIIVGTRAGYSRALVDEINTIRVNAGKKALPM